MKPIDLDLRIKDLEVELNYLKSCKDSNALHEAPKELSDFSFSDLVDCKQLQEIIDLFFSLTNLGAAIVDNNNHLLVSAGWQNICSQFHRVHPETCKNCHESDNFMMQEQIANEIKEYKCKNGMWDAAIPIVIDGKTLAAVYFGQYFYDDEVIDFGFFEQQAKEYGFDKEAYLSALKQVPVYAREKVKTVISLYSKFASFLANTGYQNLLIKRTQIQERLIFQRKLIESEQKLRTIFDIIEVGIIITDVNGMIVDCNKRFVDYVGIPSEVLKKKKYDVNDWYLIRPDGTKMAYEEFASTRALKENKTIKNVTIGIVKKDNEVTWVSVNATPIELDGYGLVIAYTEITDVVNLNKEVQQAKVELETITDNLPVIISQVDKDLKYSFANDYYNILWDINKQDIIGKKVIEVVGKEAFKRILPHIDEVLFNKCEKRVFENKVTNKIGEEIDLQMTLIPVKENDEVKGYYALGVDITELNIYKKELQSKSDLLISIADNVPALIAITNKDFRYTYTNKSFEDFFGYTKEQFFDKHIKDILGTEAFQRAYPHYLSALEGQTEVYENTVLNKDGSIRYIQVTLKPFYSNHEIIGSLILSIDITSMKNKELAIEESEARFKSMFEKHSSVMLLIEPISGRIINANQSAANFYGGTVADLCQRNINEFNTLPPELVEEERKKAVEEKRNYFIFTHMLLNGKERIVEVHSSPIIYNENLILFSIIHDITERTKAEEALKRSEKELKKLNEDKDRFISIISHDLKGPIYSIHGLLELIVPNIKNYTQDETENFIKMIYNSVHDTTQLLEEILVWARSNSGRIPFEPKLINIEHVFNDVLQNLNQVANDKNIAIQYRAKQEITVFADSNMIHTVLRNLIANAIKFTYKDGLIEIIAEHNPTNVQITVADNGVGISPEVIEKLFNLSHKITTEGTAKEKGTGLGLLLCKEFIDKHHGKIWVESTEGFGSKFMFTIPLVM